MHHKTGDFETALLPREKINADEWDAFIKNSPQGVIYAQSWYLDVICPGWKGIFVYRGTNLQAVMPLNISYKYGIHYTLKPSLCQYLGIFFRKIESKKEQELALKKDIVTEVIEKIPKNIKVFHHSFSPAFDYSLPFHWNGYKLETAYSYWLNVNETEEKIFEAFSNGTKRQIKKAESEGVSIREISNIDDIVELAKKYSPAKNFNPKTLEKLWQEISQRKSGTVLEARDEKNNLHCGLIFLKDVNRYIYLFSIANPEHKNSGAMSLIVWESIKRSMNNTSHFDFEGSMIEPVERFFRSFGATPVPYLTIKKNNFPKPLRWLTDK